MIRDLVRYRELIRNLVLKDLTLKYRGSVLGVAWSLAHPALLLGVYTLAFRNVLKVPVPHYPFFLLAALLPWNFFAAATIMRRNCTTATSLEPGWSFERSAIGPIDSHIAMSCVGMPGMPVKSPFFIAARSCRYQFRRSLFLR